MSGFVGVVQLDDAPIVPHLIHRLTKSLAFRGPDRQDVWLADRVGLGHALLRTTNDTEPDRQPCSLDGGVWISADARVDDRVGLINSLRASGRVVDADASDAKLILHAYSIWGEDCPARLLGDFAFAIWDRQRNTLFCARDPFGVKLLYYARVAGTFVVSNTLRTVRLHPGIDSALNDNAIGDFLLVGFNADPSTTFFREIHRLRPGHSLSLDVGSGNVREARYWTFPSPQRITYRRDRDYVEHFRVLLDDAVRDRMRMPDVGVFLSGGMDSTTIAAAAKAVCAERAVGTVTAHTSVSTPLAQDGEFLFTQLAAAQLNISLRCHPVGGLGPFETRETDRRLTRPEPVDSPNLDIFVGIASALAEDGRVALYGEDGDALLVGYSVRTWIRETPIARIVWEAGRYMLRSRRIPHLGLGIKRAVRDPLLRFARVQSEAATESRIPSYIQPAFAERLALVARYRALSSDYPGPESHLGRMKARLTAPQWQSLLESLDPGVTGLPLTVALPFLDLRLVAFAAAIPPVPWCQHKELLRASMRGVLPRRIIRRPKVSLADSHYAAKLRLGDERGTIARPPVENTIAYARALEPQASDTRDPLIRWKDLRVRSLDLWFRQEVVGDSQTQAGGTSDAYGPVETKKSIY